VRNLHETEIVARAMMGDVVKAITGTRGGHMYIHIMRYLHVCVCVLEYVNT